MLELTMVTQTIMVVVHRLVSWGVPHAANVYSSDPASQPQYYVKICQRHRRR